MNVNIGQSSQINFKTLTKRLATSVTQQTNYELLLSAVYSRSPSTKSTVKTQSHGEKLQINMLLQQNQELKDQVRRLTKENQALKANQDKTLQKLKYQYERITKYSVILHQIQSVKLENQVLRQNLIQFSREVQIQFTPLKAIVNHLMSEPKEDLIDILQLREQQMRQQLSLLNQKCELLNIERGDLLQKEIDKNEKIETLLRITSIPSLKQIPNALSSHRTID